MHINAVSGYGSYHAGINNHHKKQIHNTPVNQISQDLHQNIAFRGLFSSIVSSYEEKKQKENLKIFSDFLASTKNAKILMGHKIKDALEDYNDSFDDFNRWNNFAIHTNPYYSIGSEEKFFNIDTITQKPESYITYKKDIITLPYTQTEEEVCIPKTVVIGQNHSTQGITDAIYNLDEKIYMQNVQQNAFGALKADRIILYDVKNSTVPSLKFLKTLGCKSVILNNVEIDENNMVKAGSMVTMYPLSDGNVRVENVYINPIITQPCMDEDAKEGSDPTWRVTIKSKYKLTSIGGSRYRNKHDYLTKSIIQEDVKDVYNTDDGYWHGNSLFYMEPDLNPDKKNKYICRYDCQTVDNDVKKSKIKKSLMLKLKTG